MVDLHAHSDRSDGSLTPQQLIDLACRIGLRALSITDHDSLEAYDAGALYPRQQGLELVCGVELSSTFNGRAIHILGYFLDQLPGDTFRRHLSCIQQARRERNSRLTRRLQQLGLSVHLDEAEQLGRGQTGRPHFAQVLVKKGYVTNVREAFDRYLDESAPGYVERRDTSLHNVLRWIAEAGGISSWAHPARFFRDTGRAVEATLLELRAKGLRAVEAHHCDHLPEEVEAFCAAAEKLDLGLTGGSDFHGPGKSRLPLGGLHLPWSILEDLRARSRRLANPG